MSAAAERVGTPWAATEGRSRVEGAPERPRGRRAPTEGELSTLPWYRELTQAQRTIARGFGRILHKRGWVQMKYQAIAGMAMVSRPTAIKAVRALVAAGWIEQHRAFNMHGGDAARIYRAGPALLSFLGGKENASPYPVGVSSSAVAVSRSVHASKHRSRPARERRNPAPSGAGTVDSSAVKPDRRAAGQPCAPARRARPASRRPVAERLRDDTTAALGGARRLAALWAQADDPGVAAAEQRTLVKLSNIAAAERLGIELLRLGKEVAALPWCERPVSVLRLRFAAMLEALRPRALPPEWAAALERKRRAEQAAAERERPPEQRRRQSQPVQLGAVVDLEAFRNAKPTNKPAAGAAAGAAARGGSDGGADPPAAGQPAVPGPRPGSTDAGASFRAEFEAWRKERRRRE